ncbi:hypothetical protein GQR58_014398 [Nymphon striatum]|nr:hypothetical protein GQR58_014398 [Nymphon striatum]
MDLIHSLIGNRTFRKKSGRPSVPLTDNDELRLNKAYHTISYQEKRLDCKVCAERSNVKIFLAPKDTRPIDIGMLIKIKATFRETSNQKLGDVSSFVYQNQRMRVSFFDYELMKRVDFKTNRNIVQWLNLSISANLYNNSYLYIPIKILKEIVCPVKPLLPALDRRQLAVTAFLPHSTLV